MKTMFRSVLLAIGIALLLGNFANAEPGKPHRVVIQVDQNDADVMNLALNNARNLLDYYRNKSEDVDVEIVAYGPGLHMLRDDT